MAFNSKRNSLMWSLSFSFGQRVHWVMFCCHFEVCFRFHWTKKGTVIWTHWMNSDHLVTEPVGVEDTRTRPLPILFYPYLIRNAQRKPQRLIIAANQSESDWFLTRSFFPNSKSNCVQASQFQIPYFQSQSSPFFIQFISIHISS